MVNKRITPSKADFGVIRGNKIGKCEGCGRDATLPSRGKDKLCVFCKAAKKPEQHYCQWFLPHRNGVCARLAYVQVPAIAPGGQEWRCAQHGGQLKREIQARDSD